MNLNKETHKRQLGLSKIYRYKEHNSINFNIALNYN